MVRFFKRVFADLRSRRFLAEYAISLVILFALGAEVFSDLLDIRAVIGLILTVLLVLVLDITQRNRGETGLDAYLHTREELGPFRQRLENSRRLWIFAASAANILDGDNLDAIRSNIMSRKDGELRVVVLDPSSKAVADAKRQIDDQVTYQVQELQDQLHRTMNTRFEMIRKWNLPGKFEARVLDFNPGLSMVLMDAHRSSGVAIVEMYGFGHESTSQRMSVEIKSEESAVWFEYWVDQYERMWELASPLDALNGGKNTR